jgi:hypothetical protein
VNSPPPKPEVILTNFFAEPTVLLVPITSRVYAIYKYIFLCAYTHLATKEVLFIVVYEV